MRLEFHRRELFVLHQAPTQPSARSHAVVLCNPFGQEAIRAHRFYRVLSDRLAASGFDVVRFDYYGSGDSGGDDQDFDLLGSVRDAAAVAQWTLSHAGAGQVSMLGLRLGASVAMLASASLEPQATNLVLLEPVVDGASYIEQLREVNSRVLAQIFGARWKLDGGLRKRNLPVQGRAEALGFELGTALQQQLIHALPPSAPWVARCVRALILSRREESCAHWRAVSSAQRLLLRESDSEIDWATNSAMNTSIVPTRWIEQALECLCMEPAHA